MKVSCCGCSHLDRGTLSAALDLAGKSASEDLLGGALDDTTSDRKAGRLLKPEIHLTGGLATFIDTPIIILVEFQ